MTATATRPAPPAPRPATGGAAPVAAPRTFPVGLLAEVALALITIVTVLGFRRLFAGGDWVLPLLLHAVAAHTAAAVARRRGLDTPLAVAAVGAVGVLLVAWTYAGEFTTYGIPTGETFDAMSTSMSDAFAQFSDIKAPTEALDGFLIAVAGSIWLGAIVSDWAAFRSGATIEAVLPSATLFGLATVLGGDVDRVALSGAWIGAVLAFTLFRRAERLGRTSTWVGDRTGRGPRALVQLGCILALAATVVAAVVGPRLPGADDEAIVSLTEIGDGGPGTRVTVSPLVDIRNRLVQQADVEVFTVRSDVRSYWRLTSLDRFDGSIWSSNGSYGKTSGSLDEGVPVISERITVSQQYQIRALSQIWLPAAYEPDVVSVSQPVRYDEVSGTLIVDTDIPTSDGSTYGVQSLLPNHRPEFLRTASNLVPVEVAERYLGLPDDFSPRVTDTARQITAGSGSAYEAMLRLQDFFRQQFAYDLEVPPGHSGNAIESFLYETRRGYCEQFAGTFAAMARSLGVPARVAVGFTPGITEPDDPTLYRVRGEHAHAWPEVFLGEAGWVSFEPTPGRGAPFAEQYTGVPEQQVESGAEGTTATTALTPPSTDVPAPDLAVPTPVAPVPSDDDEQAVGTGEADDATNPWFGRIAWLCGLLVLAVASYLALVLAVTSARRARRRREATTPTAQVALAWEESLDAVRRAGVPVRRSETQAAAAARVGARLPTIGEPLQDLALRVQDTTYAPVPPDGTSATEALALADLIGRRVDASLPAGDRFRERFHPRNLLDR